MSILEYRVNLCNQALGRFYECQVSYNMGTRALPDTYALSPRAFGIYIRQSTCAHVITITYFNYLL